MATGGPIQVNQIITPDDILKARSVMDQLYIDEKIKEYIVDIVFATREPGKYHLPELEEMIEYGASPRASIYLHKAARAHAFLRRRGYVTPEDVKAVGMDILRHRVIPSYEAEAQERIPEDILQQIFDTIEVP
jgi:MoxR-like ATPase